MTSRSKVLIANDLEFFMLLCTHQMVVLYVCQWTLKLKLNNKKQNRWIDTKSSVGDHFNESSLYPYQLNHIDGF